MVISLLPQLLTTRSHAHRVAHRQRQKAAFFPTATARHGTAQPAEKVCPSSSHASTPRPSEAQLPISPGTDAWAPGRLAVARHGPTRSVASYCMAGSSRSSSVKVRCGRAARLLLYSVASPSRFRQLGSIRRTYSVPKIVACVFR